MNVLCLAVAVPYALIELALSVCVVELALSDRGFLAGLNEPLPP